MIDCDWRKKRYQFRLTVDDIDIYNFVARSKETESETIRKLLKFAVREIEKEREYRKHDKLLRDIMNELQTLKVQQNENHEKIIDELKQGIVINNTKADQLDDVENEVTRSVENSIDSMLDLFEIE